MCTMVRVCVLRSGSTLIKSAIHTRNWVNLETIHTSNSLLGRTLGAKRYFFVEGEIRLPIPKLV